MTTDLESWLRIRLSVIRGNRDRGSETPAQARHKLDEWRRRPRTKAELDLLKRLTKEYA